MRFSNLIFWVQENKLSEKFYKKLGFEVVRSDDELSVVGLHDFEIWLVNMRDDVQFAADVFAHQKGKGIYVYVAVDDVDAYHKQLIENGIAPHTHPKDWPWGNREFVVKDPDGYKLCFWQKISPKELV